MRLATIAWTLLVGRPNPHAQCRTVGLLCRVPDAYGLCMKVSTAHGRVGLLYPLSLSPVVRQSGSCLPPRQCCSFLPLLSFFCALLHPCFPSNSVYYLLLCYQSQWHCPLQTTASRAATFTTATTCHHHSRSQFCAVLFPPPVLLIMYYHAQSDALCCFGAKT